MCNLMCETCVLSVSGRIIYEFHVTVDVPHDNFKEVCRFLDLCREKGIKGIVIENLGRSGKLYYDVMTSSVVKSDVTEAYQALFAQADMLEEHGFRVLRRKIETVTWNYPDNADQKGYFESHMEFEVADYTQFDEIVRKFGGYTSRNRGKKGIALATLRRNDVSWWLFGQELLAFHQGLERHGYYPKKTLNEFCVYDDNKSLDDSWIFG